MDRWQRRTLYYTSFLLFSVFVFTFLYRNGMTNLEGDPRTYIEALQFVVETYTTTGYGSDSPWHTTYMNLLVIVIDIAGTVMIFLALPVFFFPAIENILSTTVPTSDDELNDHVIVATHTPRSDVLVSELESHGVDYVIAEPDREKATELYEDGYPVVRAPPDTFEGLRAVNVEEARAVVADVTDRVDASIVLTAKEIDDSVRVVSVVEKPEYADYHKLAGADEVLSPRGILGESLARTVTRVTTDVEDAATVGEELRVFELYVPHGSDLAGKTVEGMGLRERAAVNVIGAWFDDEFVSPVPPESVVESGTVLLVTSGDGSEEIEALSSDVESVERGDVVVLGHGEVGKSAARKLDETDRGYRVVDVEDGPNVDVVGDATDPDTLSEAGVDEADVVILALPDDATTEFAALITRDVNQNADIAARTTTQESVPKMYAAGADYALSLEKVSGRMIASGVLEAEEVVSTGTNVNVVETEAPGLVGDTLAEARVRDRTGCTVIGVRRDGDVLADLGPDFEIREGDDVVIAGTDEGKARFFEEFG